MLLDFSSVSQEQFQAYTHGPQNKHGGISVDEPLVLHTENPTTKEITADYYLADYLGSITELVSSNGVIDGEFIYSAFGKIVHASGNALDQCYSFTGREFDREVGVYFYRERYFDPTLGQFLQEDNKYLVFNRREEPQAQQLYTYVGNNPTNFVDPFGLSGSPPTGSTAEIQVIAKIQSLLFKNQSERLIERGVLNAGEKIWQAVQNMNNSVGPYVTSTGVPAIPPSIPPLGNLPPQAFGLRALFIAVRLLRLFQSLSIVAALELNP